MNNTSPQNHKTEKTTLTPPRRMIHLVMQGKGGAGKSFVSSLLCQFYQSKQRAFEAIDLDPVNHTLAAIKPLKAQIWNILKKADNPTIDPIQFDALVEHIVAGDGDLIVDTGSTSFLSFNNYLIQQEISQLFDEHQIQTHIHCVIRGGSSLSDCIGGLDRICNHHDPDTSTVYVWLNEVEGPTRSDGKDFEQMKTFVRQKDRIEGIIRIPEQTNELYQRDMTNMLQNAQTFQQAIESKQTGLVAKKRLTQLQQYFNDSISLHF